MKREVISEKVDYQDGERISTVTTRCTMALSEDLAKLAVYQSKLAVCQQIIEKTNEESEIARLKLEIETLKAAIKIQQGYIDSYPEETS